MPTVKGSSSELSRRSVLAGVSATPLLTAPDASAMVHPFDRWVTEAYAAMDLAWSLPEDPEGPRDRLFRRVDELDRRILLTPSTDEPAVRAKFGYLRWLMKNNGDSDELAALDHVGDFIRQHCAGPWRIYTPR
jgi:hypothetical protein